MRLWTSLFASRHSWPFLAAALLFAIVARPVGVPAAEPEKKEPVKPPAPTEEEKVKKALEHLAQYADLVQRLQEAANRQKCADNLRQIGLALQSSPAFPVLPAQLPGTSWVHPILPYLEQNNLYYGLFASGNRLGAQVEPVSEALASHLDLAKGQGLLVSQVTPESAAAKAGLQALDILLEFNGKPVARDTAEFATTLEGVKAKTPVNAVVLRKGKKVEVKAITLPEAAADGSAYFGNYYTVPPGKIFLCPSDGTSNTLLFGEGAYRQWQYGRNGGWGAEEPANSPVLTTTFRQEDRYTTRYQEGSLIITITGKLADGKATVGQIKVQDGGVEHRFPTLEKVPQEYQDKARDLVAVSEKGQGKIEIKK
jgi:hypothetical protein